ncbi:MAG: transposase, partial [Reyranella sp.]|nr:transposase [Reyranella sp.]
AHKVAGVSQAIEACGARLLYLPPYSPDLNPIENAFVKPALSEAEGLKAHVRKAAPRTIDALETAAADALLTFKPIECENLFTHAGYGFD